MPFGTFFVIPKNAPPKPAPAHRPAPAMVDHEPERQPSPAGTERAKILIIGRNMALIRDLLCSMERNMAEALQAEGLSLYTWDHDTMTDMIRRKKQLEMFFWENRQQRVCPAVGDKEATYHFCVSYAGNQRQVLELTFRCVAGNTTAAADGADAVWLLADGNLYADGDDAYSQELPAALNRLAQPGGVPVCLILSQIEGLAHFPVTGPDTNLSSAAKKRIMEPVQNAMSGAVGENASAAVLPVQLYGGLEFDTLDSQGNLVLRRCQSGYFQSYLPQRCHTPLMYSLTAISRKRGTPLLLAPSGMTLEKALVHHCAVKLGGADWVPETLGGDSQ